MKILVLLIFLLTISCSNNKVVNTHGTSALEIKSNKIVLKTTMSIIMKFS